MSNATAEVPFDGVGVDGERLYLTVKTSQAIYKGTMVAQQIADGLLVPATAAGTWPAIGKATHDVPSSAAAATRCVVESERTFCIANDVTNPFSEASQLGAEVYAVDDHTGGTSDVSGTLQSCGTFRGMEADGKIRVRMSLAHAAQVDTGPSELSIQRGTGTFAAGVLLVTGVTLRSTSVIVCARKTEAGTDGDEIRVPTADRTNGLLGTGSFTARSFLSGSAATSDTSTFDWAIIG